MNCHKIGKVNTEWIKQSSNKERLIYRKIYINLYTFDISEQNTGYVF